ncbi:hypothetical protein [Synechococcus sp. MU1650]|uniref:hypothetical protein n=1 Tax=Synechococcus sp. MU1650 TaxID=2508352 RepID=UPI001CF7F4D1|nr:hypothetical protein [Synechococcus sp. MU1650]MCB4377386.1 hypothetical protein [Synechococcus sp. MU1650]
MKKKLNSKKPEKYNFFIPPKLSSSLAEEVCSPLWKKIISSIENQEVEIILEIVKGIDTCEGILHLPHPFIDAVDTFPVKSMRHGMCNFIFFHDSTNRHRWILCQSTSFVDAIFSETHSGKHKSSPNDNQILNHINRVIKNYNKAGLTQSWAEQAIFSGYLLDQLRPYHHFYDQLKWLVHLKTKKPIISNNSFFIPKSLKRRTPSTTDQPTFSMFPLVIGSTQLGTKLDKYTDEMEKVVHDDSLKGLHGWNTAINKLKKLTGKKRTLTLWFGISGQKRIWVEQEDFLPTLVEHLKPWFDSFVFLIDGFTQYEYTDGQPIKGSKSTPIGQDLVVVDSIKKKLMPYSNASIVNLVGENYRKKIQHCQSVDFFIANAGAGQLVPHRFCKKPGILHSNEKHCVFSMGINNTTVKLVDKSLVRDVGNLFASDKRKKADLSGSGLISYSIHIEVVINMIITMLNLRERTVPITTDR